MRRVLNRIFLRNLGIGRLLLSGLAFLVGFTLVLLALQGYTRILDYLNPRRSTSNFIIVNKEVLMAHTLFGARAQFSSEDIEALKGQPFVEDLGVFSSNNFEVVAHAGGDLGLYTELFFESVPSRFIDQLPQDFSWEEGSDFLPLIVSQDFLDLYNFGFAMGKGMPQVSKSTIKLVPLKVEVQGKLGRSAYHAKVVGFSERIPSVLVPEEFLTWANTHIGNAEDRKTSRVIIKVKSDGANALEKYLEKNNLTVSDEKMKLGRFLSVLDIVMAVVLLIGTSFVAFSLMIVLMNFSLLVAQAREEVSLLLQLGYSGSQLVFHLLGYLLIFLAVVTSLSAVAWWIGNTELVRLLAGNGIAIKSSVSSEVAVMATGFVIVFFAVAYFSIRRMIRR